MNTFKARQMRLEKPHQGLNFDNVYLKTQSKSNFYSYHSQMNITGALSKMPKTESIKKFNSQIIGNQNGVRKISKSLKRSQSSSKKNLFKNAKNVQSLTKNRSNSSNNVLNTYSPKKSNSKVTLPSKNSKQGGIITNKGAAQQIINRLRNRKSLKIHKQIIREQNIKFDKKVMLLENQLQQNLLQYSSKSAIEQMKEVKLSQAVGLQIIKVQNILSQKTNQLQRIERQIGKKSENIQIMMATFQQHMITQQKQLHEKQVLILKKQKQLQNKMQGFLKENKKMQMKIVSQDIKRSDQQASQDKFKKKTQHSNERAQNNTNQTSLNKAQIQKMEHSEQSSLLKSPKNYFDSASLDMTGIQQISFLDKEIKKVSNNNEKKGYSGTKNCQKANITIKKPKQMVNYRVDKKQIENAKNQKQKAETQIQQNNHNAKSAQKQIDYPEKFGNKKPSLTSSENSAKPISKEPYKQVQQQRQKLQKQSLSALIKIIPRISHLLYFIGEIPYFCTSNMKKNKKFSFKNATLLLYKYVLDKFRSFESLYASFLKKKFITKDQYEQRVTQNISIKETYIKIKGYAYKKQPYPKNQSEKYLDQDSSVLCFQDKSFFKKHLFKEINSIIKYYHESTKGNWSEHLVNVCYFRMILAVFIIEQIEFNNVILECEQDEEYPDYMLEDIQKLTQNQLKEKMTQCYEILLDLNYD